MRAERVPREPFYVPRNRHHDSPGSDPKPTRWTARTVNLARPLHYMRQALSNGDGLPYRVK